MTPSRPSDGTGSRGQPATGAGRRSEAVIPQLYGATLEPGTWPRIMALLAPPLGACVGIFMRVDRVHLRDSTMEFFGVPENLIDPLRGRDISDDLIWQALLRHQSGEVFRSRDVIPDELLATNPIHQSIAVPAGMDYALLAVLENRPQTFVAIGFNRSDRNFDATEVEYLRALVPHLRIAMDLERRIALGDAGRQQALRSFDRAGQPLVVLDRSGYVIYSNEPACRILARADGVEVKLGRFLFEDIAVQAAFERSLRLALSATGGDLDPPAQEVRVPRRRAAAPCALSVIACARAADRAVLPPGAGAMVLIYDAENPRQLPTERLAWLYRLTPAEVRVCETLYRAGSVELTAGEMGLTRHTVRSHLKSIYAKFGVVTQGQLMGKLVSSLRMMESTDDADRAG